MIAIYAGSFSPPTLGHLDVIRRGAAMFDELVVAVLSQQAKQYLFSVLIVIYSFFYQLHALSSCKVTNLFGINQLRFVFFLLFCSSILSSFLFISYIH